MTAWTLPMQNYRSVTGGVRPPSLVAGQLFLNQADGVLCWPNASGVVQTTSLNEQTGMNIAPAKPASGYMASGYVALAKREMLGVMGSATALTPLQPLLSSTTLKYWEGNDANGTQLTNDTAMTLLGTGTVRNANADSIYTRFPRLGAVSSATAGSLAGWYLAHLCWFLGNGSLGGFHATWVAGCSDAATVSGARQFWGMRTVISAPTNVEPSTLTNVIGMGHGAADTNMMLYCAGSAAQTPINLGANFPINTLSADMYRLTVWAAKDGSINYQVDRFTGTGATQPAFSASGTFPNATPGTTAPATTTAITPCLWRSNNATALAVGLDLRAVCIMSDLA